jgi:glutathione S-transferase
MKLYYSGASCSLASAIALHEAGIAYDKTKVDLQAGLTEDGTKFSTINDKGYVPYLVMENGEGLSEGVAIMQYIADSKPASGIAPANGTLERTRLQEWLTYINSELHKTIGGLFNPTMNAETKAQTIVAANKKLAWLSTKLAGKDYLLGTFSIADGYLFTVLNWCQWVGIDLAAYPVLVAFQARVGARPKVQEAMMAAGVTK